MSSPSSTVSRPSWPQWVFESHFRDFPRLSRIHIVLICCMLSVLVAAGALFPMIDLDTLKPNEFFPSKLRVASFYSNIPIKMGLVHAIMYGVELVLDPYSAKRHIGQRMTTLWMQVFENPRFGQHFHMQLETGVQVLDMFKRDHENYVIYSWPIKAILCGIIVLMIFTNYITSCCFHTLEEQLVGALLALAKLTLIDYFRLCEPINKKVGSVYSNLRVLASGLVFALVSIFLLDIGAKLGLLNQEFLWNPVLLSSLLWLGCLIFHASSQNHSR